MTTASEIKKQWSAIAKREGTLRDTMQELAVKTLEHFKNSGDTSLMTYAYETLGERSPYRPLLSGWFKKHGNLSVNPQATASEGKLVYSIKKGHKAEEVNVEAAAADPFWVKVGGHQDFELLDPYQMLQSMLKRFDKAEDSGDYKEVRPFEGKDRDILNNMLVRHAEASKQNSK